MLCRLMTSKFPMVVVLAELAAQLRKRSLKLDLQWVPRDQNEEADALTNQDFSGFDPNKRINLKIADLKFEVLEAYMAAAAALYQDVLRRRSEGTCPTPGVPAASQHASRVKAGTLRTGAPTGGGLSPGLAAASTKSWAKAVPSQTGTGSAELAADGLRHPRPRGRKLKEWAPW